MNALTWLFVLLIAVEVVAIIHNDWLTAIINGVAMLILALRASYVEPPSF